MLLINAMSWWYTRGWAWRVRVLYARIIKTVDFFSIDLLFRTLFAPFRQIGTETAGRGLAEALKSLADNLLSRAIGFVVRMFMVLAGLVVMLLVGVVSIVELIGWLFLPLLPIIGAFLFASGWVPHVSF